MSAAVAVVTAVPLEFAAVRRRLRDAAPLAGGELAGTLGGVPVTLHRSGMGAKQAERAAARVLADHRPRALLAVGLAAGLAPELALGEIVIATHVAQAFQPANPPVAPAFQPANSLPCHPGPPHGARQGLLLHVDHVLVTAAEKRELAASGALAADMESAAVVAAALAAGRPAGAARAISDPADADLPLDFNRCRRGDGDVLPTRVAALLARSPRALPGLLRFARECEAAAAALAAFLETWLPAWAEGLPDRIQRG